MLKTAFQSIGVFLLICYMAVAGFIWRIGNEPMHYRGVKVVVCDSLDAQFIEAHDLYLALRPDSVNPAGHLVEKYDTYRLERLIKRNPLVRDAHCYQTPDSMLRVDIYQRHPILRIKSNRMNRDCYLDTDGILMNYKHSRIPIRVPLATGNITKEMATGPLYTLAQFFAKEDDWRNTFTQIYVEENGDIRLIPRVGDHTVLLGPIDNYKEKFDNLERFQKKVLDKGNWNKYKTINLKFKGQVVAEKR